MTVRRSHNGDLVVSRSFAALVPLAILIMGLAIGWGIAWGAVIGDVSDLKAERCDYMRKDVADQRYIEIGKALDGLSTQQRTTQSMLLSLGAKLPQ